MSVNPNTTFVANAVLPASQMNRLPFGVMGNVYRDTGNVACTVGSAADITGMSVTFTALASRTYKATWTATGFKSTNNGWVAVFLTTSANAIVGTVYNTGFIVGTEGYWNCSGITYFSNLAAGSTTLKLRNQTENASATVLASSTNPCILMIEDCGPS